MEEMRRQRQHVYLQDQCALSGVSIFGQLVIGGAFYLYGHVSTPGYLSILLTLPFLLALAFLSLFLARRAGGKGVLEAAGPLPGKIIGVLLSLIFLLDAQMAAFAICAMLTDALPHLSPLLSMIALALLTAAAIGGEESYALARLSRLLRWVLLILLAFCALAALPHGSLSYLFPVLGEGMENIAKGSLWMSGCLAGACCPLLLPPGTEPLTPLPQKGRMLYRPLIFALIAGTAYALLSACLLPFYALARPENLGWRMLLFAKISGSSAAWSLLFFAMMFLMLISLSAGVLRSASLLSYAAGKRRPKASLITLLLLLLTPAATLKSLPVQHALLALAPIRGIGVLMLLGALCILSLFRKKEAAQ